MKNSFCIYLFSILLSGCIQQSPKQLFSFNKNTGELKWDKFILSQSGEKQEILNIKIDSIEDYLELSLSPLSSKDTTLVFPKVSGDSYYIPIGEGKFFSSKDTLWMNHLQNEEYAAIENLSMPFFAVAKGEKAILYLFENPCRNTLYFVKDSMLHIHIKNDFVNIDSVKQNKIRIYITDNNPVSIAATYKRYIIKEKGLMTLKEKAEENPNIRKLFGAPHFYLWDISHNAIPIIKEMADKGIGKAWIGIDTWNENTESLSVVEQIEKNGYLVAPYDSYHSIHEPQKEKWETASFADTTLYTHATIKKKDGNYLTGFLKNGRLLNPVYTMDAVRRRTRTILASGVLFNSWFLDCDATGAVEDDYAPSHWTSKQQNLQGRIDRMTYVRDSLHMVIGSEDGHDFACSTIAFAHGVEMPVFTWMDWEMNKQPDSKYYVGSYGGSKGKVASRFSKQIPLKEKFRNLFYNPVYTVPLYKLVYNDVVVTAPHWEWPSLKVPTEAGNRMLYEISYNAAPLYHLDTEEWEKHKKTITRHIKVWAKFSKDAILNPMTDFKYLTNDKEVQYTQYGERIRVITNYSDSVYMFQKTEIPPKSLIIINNGIETVYTPQYLTKDSD